LGVARLIVGHPESIRALAPLLMRPWNHSRFAVVRRQLCRVIVPAPSHHHFL